MERRLRGTQAARALRRLGQRLDELDELGPRFQGIPLRSVTVGVYSVPTRKGERLHCGPYVRFVYGRALTVEVFGKRRPWFYRHGPRPGTIVRDWGNYAAVTRDGLLIRFSRFPSLTSAVAVSLAHALRPLPAG